MTTDALRAYLPHAGRVQQILAAPLWMWSVAAVLAFAALGVLSDPPPLSRSLGDTDDATRLTQVREFLAGASWFDMTLARFGGAEPLVSHWSRLVDLPLALLLSVFGLFLSGAQAETAVRIVWPLMLLVPLMLVVSRAAEERGGRVAALIALALAALAFAGTVQFRPGRIDHHNVMNLAAIAGILLLAGAFSKPQLGRWAGAVLGLGMAVGFESMLVTGAGLAIAVLLSLWTGRGREAVRDAAMAFAAVLTIIFILTTAPSRWFDVRCDALSLNMVLLALTGAAGLWGIGRHGGGLTREAQFGALAATGATALTLYLLAEPACLGGPFGQVDPAIYPLWLEHVAEAKSIVWLFQNIRIVAVANVLSILAGLAAMGLLLRRERDDGALFYAAVLLATSLFALLQIKLIPYAMLLAIPPLALAISRIEPTAEVSAATLRFGATMVLNQKALLLVAALVAGFKNPVTEAFKVTNEIKKACYTTGNISALAGLPRGLAVADVDMGPYIVALTSLDVLSAPYHRLDKAIIETHAILDAQPAEAERRLRALDAAYVVTCTGLAASKTGTAPAGALKPALLAGETPAFLEPIPLAGDTPVRVWRVKRH